MKQIFEFLGYLAVLATLLGVSATTLLTDPEKAWTALALVVSTALFICFQVYRMVRAHLNAQHPTGFLPLSSFAKYATSDGKNITYEMFRHLQIKLPCTSHFEHKFMWTGSTPPKVESDIQEVGQINSIPGETTKSIKLKFKKAKIYNDVEVIHLNMSMDDSDNKSKTFLQHNVSSPISFISFKVELLHAGAAYFGKHATLSRKDLLKGVRANTEFLQIYPFDAMSKSFSCNMNNPEPGYSYTLSWDRP